MKRAFIFILLAFVLTGCSESKMASDKPIVGADDDPSGLFGDGSGTDDNGIPIEDDAAEAEAKKPAVVEPRAQVIKPVEIRKSSGSLGSCVIGNPCEKTITAKGGSGQYIWSIEGALPRGMEFVRPEGDVTKKAKIRTIAGQEIEEVGDFSFALEVADAADASQTAKKNFRLSVSETIAMVLYTMWEEEGQKKWVQVEGTDANGHAVPITVPPRGILLVEVIGHALSYKWSINGQEIVCNDQGCEGMQGGLRLFRDTSLTPPDPPEHYAYMILQAQENFIGHEKNDVVIAAADAFGNAASKTISSITFQQEPCKIGLTVKGGSPVIKKVYGKPYEILFQVEGGSGALTWTPLGKADSVPSDKTTVEIQNEGRTAVISGKIDARDGMTLAEYLAGEQIQLQYALEDSCAPKNTASVAVTVQVKGDEGIMRVDPDERSSSLHLGANDTDSSSKITLFLTDSLNQVVGQWAEAVGLDQYGDGECGWFCYDIDANHGVSQPPMTFVDSVSVDGISKVRFLVADPGSGGWVDIKINEYSISFPHWTGVAQGNNKEENDRDDGSYLEYDIAWTYTN